MTLKKNDQNEILNHKTQFVAHHLGSVEKVMYFMNAWPSLLIGRHKAALYADLQSYRVATGLVSVVIIC